MNTQCLDNTTLESAASGAADAALRERVQSHCAACAACASRLKDIETDQALVVALLRVPEVRSIMRGRSRAGAGNTRPGWPRIDGFDLVREVGAGGMGVVFEATQNRPQRRVAVKVLSGAMRERDAESLRRLKCFLNEGEALARLNHPNIAAVHFCGQCENGDPFIAMEYVEGETLDAFVRRSKPSQSARLALIEKVCRGVQHAHQRGVVHLDLKPGNVIVDAAGEPKVVDFGLARQLDGGGRAGTERAEVTTVGVVAGTAGFMSPEQARADGAPADARSDVYALGALAFATLTGAPPPRVDGGPAKGLRAGTVRVPLEGRERERRWIEHVLARALEEQPHARYASASALADDLQRCRSGVRPEASPKRARLGALAAVSAIVLIAAGTAVWIAMRPNDPVPRPAPPPVPAPTPGPNDSGAALILGPGLKVSDPAMMEAQARRALEAGPPYAKSSSFAMTLYAMMLDRRGEHAEAERVLRAVTTLKMDNAPQGGVAVAEARLARVLAARGKSEETEALLASAARRVQDRDGRWGVIVAGEDAAARARLLAKRGDVEGARELLTQAFTAVGESTRFNRSGARSLVAIELAALLAASGDARGAQEWGAKAIEEESRAEAASR